MLEKFPRNQLYSIIQRYGQSLVEDTRRCKGLLKDLAPKHQRETNLLMLVLEHKLIGEILQETQLPVSVKLDRLAQKLHDNVGIQKYFALWAIESWAIALDISPVTDTFNQIVEDTENEELFELGQKFYENEEYNKAHEYYLLAAEKGHAKAQYELGKMHYYGTGVKKNNEEAFKWYRLSAENGYSPEAIWGIMMLSRDGYVEALEALFLEGEMYYHGIGVDADDDYAFEMFWLEVANLGHKGILKKITDLANEGSDCAQFYLGELHYFGIGGDVNEEEAFKWYGLVATQSNDTWYRDRARETLAEIYYELGCEYESGEDYENGEDVEQDITKAIKYFRLAAEYGHPAAQLVLAETLYHGLGMEEESIKWYQQAAAHQFGYWYR